MERHEQEEKSYKLEKIRFKNDFQNFSSNVWSWGNYKDQHKKQKTERRFKKKKTKKPKLLPVKGSGALNFST